MSASAPQPSTISDLAERFAHQLRERDDAALLVLMQAYQRVQERLRHQLDGVLTHIEQARTDGELTTPTWLARQARITQYLRQVEHEIATIADLAHQRVTSDQAFGIQDAQDYVARVIGAIGAAGAIGAIGAAGAAGASGPARASAGPGGAATPTGGIRFTRLPAEAAQQLTGVLSDGSPLSTLLDQLGPHASAAVQEALTIGLLLGEETHTIAGRVQQAFGDNLTRSLTVVRTEVMRASRTATLDNARHNAEVFSGWLWLSAVRHSRRPPCPVCLALHGTFHPLSESFGSHPRCRCVPMLVPKGSGLENTIESGPDRFARWTPAQQARLLGPGKYAAYQAGAITLPDLVRRTRHPQWGVTYQEASLGLALRQADARRRREVAAA